MKRTRKKTTKQETLQQPTVAITMTAEDKAAAEKVAALREAEAAQKAREDAIEATYRKRFDRTLRSCAGCIWSFMATAPCLQSCATI